MRKLCEVKAHLLVLVTHQTFKIQNFSKIQRSRQIKKGTNQREHREKNHFKAGVTVICVTTPSSVIHLSLDSQKEKSKKRVGKMFVEVRAAMLPDGNNPQGQGAQRSQA